jgi:hypothetical protein
MAGMRIRSLPGAGGGYVQDLETTDLEYIPWQKLQHRIVEDSQSENGRPLEADNRAFNFIPNTFCIKLL